MLQLMIFNDIFLTQPNVAQNIDAFNASFVFEFCQHFVEKVLCHFFYMTDREYFNFIFKDWIR